MFLYHCFEKRVGPYKNLSDLPAEEAKEVISEYYVSS